MQWGYVTLQSGKLEGNPEHQNNEKVSVDELWLYNFGIIHQKLIIEFLYLVSIDNGEIETITGKMFAKNYERLHILKLYTKW